MGIGWQGGEGPLSGCDTSKNKESNHQDLDKEQDPGLVQSPEPNTDNEPKRLWAQPSPAPVTPHCAWVDVVTVPGPGPPKLPQGLERQLIRRACGLQGISQGTPREVGSGLRAVDGQLLTLTTVGRPGRLIPRSLGSGKQAWSSRGPTPRTSEHSVV